ncbi:hypothetical protein CPLU01_09178 [Colletotrichum plurivorum]|uniref:Uncharacterized protein n=1 Tax=Colletotrichum plurivorum TaxID=2175906 RepID=A0A8H6KA58_9PEZI|nr:hypothetical protein CPLU01_09178 [Colletotrichum plurivorum]
MLRVKAMVRVKVDTERPSDQARCPESRTIEVETTVLGGPAALTCRLEVCVEWARVTERYEADGMLANDPERAAARSPHIGEIAEEQRSSQDPVRVKTLIGVLCGEDKTTGRPASPLGIMTAAIEVHQTTKGYS